jgi:hypothetical protein
MGKKALNKALFSLKCHVENKPANMEYVVKQAEVALEKAVTSAKIDVKAYINTAINKIGLQAAKNIGLTSNAAQGFITNN